MAQNITVVQEPKGSKKFYAPAPGSTAPMLILAANPNRVSALIINAGSQTVYLGGTGGIAAGVALSSTSGNPLLAGASITDNSSTDEWWGIAASTTGDLRITEVTKPAS